MRFIKFMKFNFVWLFIFVLAMGGVFGAGNESDGLEVESGGDGKVFTAEFYIALLIGIVVLAVIGWVIWLVIRGPRNKWDK